MALGEADPKVVERLIELTSLNKRDATKIARAGRLVNVPAHWSLIWEKTPADHAYYLLEGEVSITRDQEEVTRLGPGEIIGEVAIVSKRLRTASVITQSPVQALTFDAEHVAWLSDEIPRVAEALKSNTAERLDASTG